MVSFYRPLIAFSIIPLLSCQDCENTITPPTYNLSSPNYPRNYPNELQCTWTISVEKSSRIYLRFMDFEFEKGWSSGTCYDSLTMWDGGDDIGNQVFQSCAESLEEFKAENTGTASFNSLGNMFFLWMTTDYSMRRRGFRAVYIPIPEPTSTTETVGGSTSPDAQRTPLKSTTEDKSTPSELIVSKTTLFALSSTSLTTNSVTFNPATDVSENTLPSIPSTTTPSSRSTYASSSEKPSSEPNETRDSSTLLVVVPTVSFVLLLACLCVTGIFIYKRRSSGKINSSPNENSFNGVGTVKDHNNPYSETLYYNNESFHSSSHDVHPPPYPSKDHVDNVRTSRLKSRAESSEGFIVNPSYGLNDREQKYSGKYEANTPVDRLACENYGGEKIVNGNFYPSKSGNIADIAYESYDEQENVQNDNVGDTTNIAYESYDGHGKEENYDHSPNEGGTTNVVYEGYDKQETTGSSDDIVHKGDVSNIAYESYDWQRNANNYNTDNIGDAINIAFESYDREGKVENYDHVPNEGGTTNAVYESYDQQDNSGSSDDIVHEGNVSNIAYESYDGENSVTYNTDGAEYQAIDDDQSVDDDYSKTG